jgi:hypothetical protein
MYTGCFVKVKDLLPGIYHPEEVQAISGVGLPGKRCSILFTPLSKKLIEF